MDEPLESAPVCSVTIAIDPDGSIRRFATGVMPCEAQKLIGGLRAMITTLSDWQEERVRCGLGCCRESRT